MKKAIVSTLCSAFVIPGLGQVLNQHLKKGAIILVAVFIIFVAGTVKLYRMLSTLLAGLDLKSPDSSIIMARLREEDPFFLWCLLTALAVLWLYSVIDALVSGMKIDQRGEKGNK